MTDSNKILQIEADIVMGLKNVFDPEIPVNVYDLGLIYEIDVKDTCDVDVTMTLTAPNCPMADQVMADVQNAVETVHGVKKAEVKLVFDPPWDQNMLTEEAKLELGLL
jgi:FeS assembly SUF system protein